MSISQGGDPDPDDVTPIRPKSSFPTPIEDTDGYDLRPNPLTASTAAELMSLLRQFRIWCGKPGYRVMSRRANNVIAAATMHSALQTDRLPKLDTLQAIVRSCSGSEDDVRNWTTAWRKITLAEQPHKD
jgi:hypothetical protein